jgi:Tfp pilus assembly protein PilN
MLEFNLLPDVKLNYLRTKRLEHLVIFVSFIVGAASIAVFILLFLFVDVAQKVSLDNLTTQINTDSSKLSSNKNLNQMLTVQNQLQSLPSIENQSPTTSRLFGFITQLTPVNATISDLTISFTPTNTVTITGGADSLTTVNTFVDTLKYATYNNSTDNTTGTSAFNTVVLSSFNYSNSASSGGDAASPAQYTISFNFDPTLFDAADNISLVVPSETTTRSIINQPTLFKAEPKSATTNSGT